MIAHNKVTLPLAAISTIIALALPLGAIAQPVGPPPGDTGTSVAPPPPGAGSRDGAAASTGSRPQSTTLGPDIRIERRIIALHRRLQITPSQEAQWNTFAQVMRDDAHLRQQTLDQRASGLEHKNAVDNLSLDAAIAEQHALNMQRLVAAFKPLYASFTGEQKLVAGIIFSREPAPRRTQMETRP